MTKRTSINSGAYVIGQLSYALIMYVEQNKHEKFRNASVAIKFIHTIEDRRIIHDFGNIEKTSCYKHHIINTISIMFLVDDNTIDMELFNRPDDYVHTEIIVSSKDKNNEEGEKTPKIFPLRHITLLPFFDELGLYVKSA